MRHVTEDSDLVMVEYSSPNTNKPLHLGHVRNNLLGYSLSQILKANGNKVVKTNIVNDRGIHICKSMLAWKKWGEGATPDSTGKKGDHLIGDFYVAFDRHFKEEVKEIMARENISEEEAKEKSPLMEEARGMLRGWEQGDPEVRALWKMMNDWVYAGFDETYRRLGVDFDKIYYESDTYLEGKELVLKGLEEGKMKRREDGSVWADLTAEGLDHKLLPSCRRNVSLYDPGHRHCETPLPRLSDRPHDICGGQRAELSFPGAVAASRPSPDSNGVRILLISLTVWWSFQKER